MSTVSSALIGNTSKKWLWLEKSQVEQEELQLAAAVMIFLVNIHRFLYKNILIGMDKKVHKILFWGFKF